MLPASILVAALLISGSLIYLVQSGGIGNQGPVAAADPEPTVFPTPTVQERDVIIGDPNAPISIIEYADFQCPFCGTFFEETAPQLRSAYVETGRAKMTYRHLAFLGPESVAAAEASECAKDQGKFWSFHDEVYKEEIADGVEHNGNLNKELFVKIATNLELDVPTFSSCVDTRTHQAAVAAQVEEAATFGVNSTPTVFVNDQKVEGAYPFEHFQQIIEAIKI